MRTKRTTTLHTTAHKQTIRVILLAIAGLLLAYSLAISTPMGLARSAQSMLASAIGVTAGVPENPINSLVKQLNDQQMQLDEREAELVRRENEQLMNNKLALYSFGASLILFVMVGANFYLDVRRGRQRAIGGNMAVDLRRQG